MPRTTCRTSPRTLATGLTLATALGVAALTPTAALAAPPATAPAPGYVQGQLMNYAVNVAAANRGQTLKVERAVAAAGGSVVASYAEIGVVIARSANTNFAAALRSEKAVDSVGATRTAAVAATDPTLDASDPLARGESGKGHRPGAGKPGPRTSRTPSVEDSTVTAADPREAEQWDMQAIGADQAHLVTDGSRDVLVAVLDSGIQGDHPDLAANIDTGASASCLSGSADPSYASWQPTTSDHGTHVAGTIAAARNGIGIVGVAPNVRLSSVKVVDDDGYIYPEAAICGFMQAVATGAAVTNNSYYIDPWQFWCDDDADQRAVKTAVDRAVQYSQRRGVVNVAAAGNSDIDLAHKTVDDTSPDDTTPVTRTIDASCEDMPAELGGVVTVSSTDRSGARSYFSNYGEGVIDVAAPGRSILSTIVGGEYGYKSGTSMASPHVAGVVALLKSTHPQLSGTALTDLLYAQANDVPCPTGTTTCTGTPQDNGYFGEGLVDALDAVR
jgi:subtilisin family serine protease